MFAYIIVNADLRLRAVNNAQYKIEGLNQISSLQLPRQIITPCLGRDNWWHSQSISIVAVHLVILRS
jgi:hypothetical protein